jgi:hypothetical protein
MRHYLVRDLSAEIHPDGTVVLTTDNGDYVEIDPESFQTLLGWIELAKQGKEPGE